MKLPLFPLETVVFPGQELSLHIFENRYRQLIHEAWQNESTFGIPTLMGSQISVHAAEMKVMRITKMYDDGRMDILIKGEKVLRVKEFYEKMKGRLYPGGEVEPMSDDKKVNFDLMDDLLTNFTQLNSLLNRSSDDCDFENKNLSFQIGHKIGFSLKQKIKLLSLPDEVERQKLINNYLIEVIPILETVVKNKK